MRNKIFMILGILIIVVAMMAYLTFENTIREHSEVLGYDILIAKADIPEGTIIRTTEEAEKFFGTRRIPQNEVVSSAIHIEGVVQGETGIISTIRNLFLPPEKNISPQDLQNLTNKKIVENIFQNQQILKSYLSADIAEFAEGERFFAVPVTAIASVGGKIEKDDYVDVWVQYKDGVARKIVGPLQIIEIRDSNSREIEPGDVGRIPAIVIFKLNQEHITVISQKMNMGTMFLTKWGTTPQFPARLENLPAE